VNFIPPDFLGSSCYIDSLRGQQLWHFSGSNDIHVSPAFTDLEWAGLLSPNSPNPIPVFLSRDGYLASPDFPYSTHTHTHTHTHTPRMNAHIFLKTKSISKFNWEG
jgi:hypothetical protein